MVVFYRVHAQSRVLEEALRAADIGYRVVGGTRFYDRAEVKDLLAYLRVIHNIDDDVSLLRIVNVPARGIGKTTVERLLDAAAKNGAGVWSVLSELDLAPDIGAAARKKLGAFVALIEELRGFARDGIPLVDLGRAILDRSGYVRMLEGEDSPEADARLQNLGELIGSMEEFQQEAEDASLASFLELVTLQTSADEGAEGERLTLMTVHAAKGLEFPVVMVTGLEEQMFPFRGTEPWSGREELEEERRLAYVAFTRAEERLVLSWARVRRIFGDARFGTPSRFLAEMPAEDVQWIGATPPGRPAPRHATPAPSPRRSTRAPSPRPEAEPLPPTETFVDTSEGSDFDGLRRGMPVRHKKFGVGRVREVGAGLPPRVTVEFPGWGTKKIVAEYLEPA
jgi:DNA helicase-2/ATP-dependent DNA helicase PcrA